METKDFMDLVDDQLRRCKRMLEKKAELYAPGDDRLAQFKVMGNMQGVDAKTALSGVMAKHSATLHQMLCDGHPHTDAQWRETITDTMNYCLLALGLVMEK